MKKIAMFGATGMTGLCALDHAIKKGFQVRLLVRNEATLPEQYKGKVDVVLGDVTDSKAVEKVVQDQEGVVVILGTRNDLKPTTVLSDGLKNIIQAMKQHKVEKISVCLSAFLFWEVEKVPQRFQDLNADHQRMFDAIKASDLKWIAVLPPHIAETEAVPFTVKHDMSPGRVISKWNLGSFLVDCLEQSQHYQKVCGLANNL